MDTPADFLDSSISPENQYVVPNSFALNVTLNFRFKHYTGDNIIINFSNNLTQSSWQIRCYPRTSSVQFTQSFSQDTVEIELRLNNGLTELDSISFYCISLSTPFYESIEIIKIQTKRDSYFMEEVSHTVKIHPFRIGGGSHYWG